MCVNYALEVVAIQEYANKLPHEYGRNAEVEHVA